MNIHQISKVSLTPDVVDGIVFWTKNPAPMLERLRELKAYTYYFQFTCTPYGEDVEPNLPSKRRVILPAFQELSDKIGPERVIWRYDPIFISEKYTVEKHIRYFEEMADILNGYTKRCIISFIDMYRNTASNLRGLGLQTITDDDMRIIARAFSEIAEKYGMELCTCSEAIDLSPYGVAHASCIDKTLLERLNGCKLHLAKDPNQRKDCGCAASVDIGAYHCCKHMCKYCYANAGLDTVERNVLRHRVDAPLLIGEVGEADCITERRMVSLRVEQLSLF